jgi:hypothetical protein
MRCLRTIRTDPWTDGFGSLTLIICMVREKIQLNRGGGLHADKWTCLAIVGLWEKSWRVVQKDNGVRDENIVLHFKDSTWNYFNSLIL